MIEPDKISKTNPLQPEFDYRKGTLADINQLIQLTLHAYGQFNNILTNENVEAWKTNFGNESMYTKLLETGSCFVCEHEKKIVGMAFLVPHGNPTTLFQDDWSYLRLVGVHADYEGKGIGRKLTQMCVDLAKESGEKIVALHTSEFQNAARHIYESMGFKKFREFESYGKRYWVFKMEL